MSAAEEPCAHPPQVRNTRDDAHRAFLGATYFGKRWEPRRLRVTSPGFQARTDQLKAEHDRKTKAGTN